MNTMTAFPSLPRTLKFLAVLIACIAVTIGTVAKMRPEMFLKIPKIGFIFWKMSGGPIPPFFERTPWEEKHFRKWAQDGDIVQATMPKSGTMWLAQIVHLMRNNGTDDYSNVHDILGMIEFVYFPGDTLKDRIDRENKKREAAAVSGGAVPMSWFSHGVPNERNYGLNPTKNPTIKYLVTAREGKEVVRSFVPFLNGHTEESRTLWGGFPPPLSKEDAVNMVSFDIPDFYFGFLKAWWPFRHEPNVLLIHYSDMTKDLKRQVERIAEFLDIDLSDPVVFASVLEKSSFDYMKKNCHKYVSYMGRERNIIGIREGVHINKGNTGGTSEFFTDSMNEVWERAVKTHFADADPKMVEWASYGGVY